MTNFGKKPYSPLQLAILVVLVLAYKGYDVLRPKPPVSEGVAAIQSAFAGEQSGMMVEAAGVVKKVLPDDNDGDRHQKLIVDLGDRHSILISHNIDVAPRVPVKQGESIEFRGQYEWSEQGGVVHWTHHAPGGRREGGWIRHAGQLYE